MVYWLEILNRTFQLFSRDNISDGINFINKIVLGNMSFLAIGWGLIAFLLPGFFLVVILDGSIEKRKTIDVLESLCLAGALGFSFLAQIGHLLDIFFAINTVSISISIILLGILTLFLRKKEFSMFFKKQTISKRGLMHISVVVALGTLIRLYNNYPDQIISTLGLPYLDPYAHFYWGRVVSVSGHALVSPLTPNLYPNGFFYVLGIIFLPNDAIQNYYLAWLFIPFILVLFSTLSMYLTTLKITANSKAALFSSLVFNTSWLILQRTRALLSDNLGFVIIPLLLYLLLDKKRRYIFSFLYGSLFIMNPIPALWFTTFLLIYSLIILIRMISKERSVLQVSLLVRPLIPIIALILLFSAPQWLRSLPLFINPGKVIPGESSLIVTPSEWFKFEKLDWYYYRDTGPITVVLAILGTAMGFIRREDRRLQPFVWFFIITLVMAQFHIVFFKFILGHKPKRILMYNILTLAILASTGMIELQKYLSTWTRSKNLFRSLSKLGSSLNFSKIIILLVILQQLAVGAINAGTYYFPNSFRDDEIRALFWLDQNTAPDVTIVEYTDLNKFRTQFDVSWFLYPRRVLKNESFYKLETSPELIEWVLEHNVDFILLRTEDLPDFYSRFHEIISKMTNFELVLHEGAVFIYRFK